MSIAPLVMPVCVITVVLILTPMVSHAIAPSYHQRTVSLTLYVSCNPKTYLLHLHQSPSRSIQQFCAGWRKCENASFVSPFGICPFLCVWVFSLFFCKNNSMGVSSGTICLISAQIEKCNQPFRLRVRPGLEYQKWSLLPFSGDSGSYEFPNREYPLAPFTLKLLIALLCGTHLLGAWIGHLRHINPLSFANVCEDLSSLFFPTSVGFLVWVRPHFVFY